MKREPAADRPTYKVILRAEPGVDAIRSLRLALKFLLRRFHLRCLSVEAVPAKTSKRFAKNNKPESEPRGAAS
jgi:hypothetical protein